MKTPSLLPIKELTPRCGEGASPYMLVWNFNFLANYYC